MASAARIVVLVFSDRSVSRLSPWRAHAAAATGNSAPVVKRAAVAAVWQLAAPNNRPLARSAGVFDVPALALADAHDVVAAGPRLVPVLVRREHSDELGWHLLLDERPVVTCSRWYLADRDRRKALDAALEAFAHELVAPVVRSIDPEPMGQRGLSASRR